jgi:hypothetical protein
MLTPHQAADGNDDGRPLTLKTFLILAALVAAMLCLPKLIVALLP